MCLQNPGEPERYSGVLKGLMTIYRHEGLGGLYKGLVPSLFGTSHGALQFMAYEELKVILDIREGVEVVSSKKEKERRGKRKGKEERRKKKKKKKKVTLYKNICKIN